MGKEIRAQWKESRFSMGKNKVMQAALGTSPEDEQADDLHKLAEQIGSTCGLLFTNNTVEEVTSYFRMFCEEEFAVAGNILEGEEVLPVGVLPGNFPTSMVEQLKKLGLPAEVKNGSVVLSAPHSIYKPGKPISA